MKQHKHITDKASDVLDDVAQPLKKRDEPGLVGPSTNPATNMLIADIAMRAIGRLTRNTLHKTVLQTRYGHNKAARIVENRSIGSTLALYGLSKIATRSVPGALLVSGGLLAKTLYDRSGSKRRARRHGEKELDMMAAE